MLVQVPFLSYDASTAASEAALQALLNMSVCVGAWHHNREPRLGDSLPVLHTLSGVSHLVCGVAQLVSNVLLQEHHSISGFFLTALQVPPALLLT